MEAHPPKLIERILGAVIPPACREHVLGDLYERYVSTAQYILDALATLPFIIASQIRRTFRVHVFFAQACAIYLAFGGASLVGGPSFLYDRGAVLSLGVVVAVVLLMLVLCDAYADPQNHSSRRPRFVVALALSVAWFAKGIFDLVAPEHSLPNWLMLIGSAAGFPMLLMLRSFFRKDGNVAATAGSAVPPDENHRRSAQEYRRAWRMNSVWMTAALLVAFITPKTAVSGSWAIASAIFLVVMVLITGLRSKEGRTGTDQEFTSLSISRNPYRTRLERKRDGLLFFSSGGLFALAPGAGPTLVLCLIALPLVLFFLRWLFNAPSTPEISISRVWITFVAFVILSVAWVFVRAANLRAAKAMREELEALDSKEKEKR
jgi:hypothetical protein